MKVALFTSGFSFNVPTQEVVDEFEDGDNRKEAAILDIDAWAAYYRCYIYYRL